MPNGLGLHGTDESYFKTMTVVVVNEHCHKCDRRVAADHESMNMVLSSMGIALLTGYPTTQSTFCMAAKDRFQASGVLMVLMMIGSPGSLATDPEFRAWNFERVRSMGLDGAW